VLRELATIVAAIVVASAIFAVWSRWRYRRLARARSAGGAGFAGFERELCGIADHDVLRSVYDHFSAWAAPGFPVLSSDDVDAIYGMVGEDLDDEVIDIARKCGVNLKPVASHVSVRTVADVAAFIQASRGEPRRPVRPSERPA
jgi:hypothetical protein